MQIVRHLYQFIGAAVTMKLYSYFNRSAAYRVRIALSLKNIDFQYEPVNIRHEKSQKYSDYKNIVNNAGFVPSIGDSDFTLSQSLAIIDYLDNKYPQYKLIPEESFLRAKILEFSYLICCDIHPLNNLRVLRFLLHENVLTEKSKNDWYIHWIKEGFDVAESLLKMKDSNNQKWCFSDKPSLAECCLIPQVANALRVGMDISGYKKIVEIYNHAINKLEFIRAQPESQKDFISQ